MNPNLDDDPRRLLHTPHRWDDFRSVLRLPVDSFIGIDAAGREVLGSLGIHDVFDLAYAPVFGAATILVDASGDPDHPFHRLGRVAESLVDGRGDQLEPERWPSQPLVMLSGLGQVYAPAVEEAFDLVTIGDLAAWPPYRAAVEVARQATGVVPEAADDTGTPADLLPRNGQYPTDKVYYRSLLLREFADSDRGISLESDGGLDLGRMGEGSSTGVGYGALVTWEQLWYGQGLVLGNLLHSLALAPGEATMVAIVDWTRSVSATTSETVAQIESLSASTAQNRALSEVTQGVTNEIQSGFSTNNTSSTTAGAGMSSGAAGSATIPLEGVLVGLGGGGGNAAGVGHTEASSITVAFTTGSRDTFAEYAQQVSESTQQQANSARSRRASVVQEVRESTSEQLQTRVVANYNHMHAMSMCYYEIVQIYRVVLHPSRVEKCAFVPMTPLDFTDDAILDRFAAALRAVALDPIVTKVLASAVRVSIVCPAADAVYERLPIVVEFPIARSSTVPEVIDRGDLPGPIALVDVTIPGPLEVSPTSTVTYARATVGEDEVPITVWFAGSRRVSASADVEWPVLDLEVLQVSVPIAAPADPVELVIGVTTGGAEQRYRMTLGTAGGTSDGTYLNVPAAVVVGGDISATDLGLAKAHLAANAAWYTARIWERLDDSSVSALLTQYRYQGRPLLAAIDPRVLSVTGTHVVFRMLLDDAGRRRWEQELDEWGLTGPDSKQEDFVPLPTGGVFAEAVLGRSNSAEPLDVTRFWNWQDSPPPFAPPAIADLQAGQQDPTEAPSTGSLDPSLVSMVQPSPFPDPTGLASTLGLLGAAGSSAT